MDQNQNEDQEADRMLKSLEEQAEAWREKLKVPATQELIRQGKLQLSPLVKKLLSAFPPVRKKLAGG